MKKAADAMPEGGGAQQQKHLWLKLQGHHLGMEEQKKTSQEGPRAAARAGTCEPMAQGEGASRRKR